MDEHSARLEEQLKELSLRLGRIERQLGIDALPPAPSADQRQAEERTSVPTPAQAATKALDLEQRVGARWYAVLGASILIVGVGLGFKWAYDAGLLRIPPAWRCLLGAGFGFALLGAGEALRKRYGVWAAAGASIAGTGTIFLSTFAAYRLYALLPPGTAFVLLAATAGVGIAVGVRARLAAVGVTSLVAGYIVPLLFADVPSRPLVMPAYLLALLGVGLVLSGRLGGRFAALRTTAWWGTILMGGVWALSRPAGGHAEALVFLALAWGAIQGELVYSARRHGLGTPGAPDERRLNWMGWRTLLSSLATTWWAAAIAVPMLDQWGVLPNWFAPATPLPVCAVLWLVLAGHLRLLQDPPTTDSERLGVSMGLQSASLLIATVALALEGSFEVIGWLALGVASTACGRRLRSRAVLLYGLLLLGIATFRLVVYDSWSGALTTGGVDVLGLNLTLWSLLMALAGVGWIASSALIWGDGARLPRAWASVAGLACVMGSVMSEHSEGSAIVLGWTLLAAAAIASHRGVPRLGLHFAGVLALVATSIAWFAVHLAGAGSNPQWLEVDAALLLHPGLWSALLLAGAWALGAVAWKRWRGDWPPSGIPLLTCVFAASALVFISTSFEVARVGERLTADPAVRGAAVSVWWGLFAMGLLAFGFQRRLARARHAGLALLGVAALKAVVFDLATVSMLWRFISFIGLGLLMLTVTVVYGRVGAQQKKARRGREGDFPDGTPDA